MMTVDEIQRARETMPDKLDGDGEAACPSCGEVVVKGEPWAPLSKAAWRMVWRHVMTCPDLERDCRD